MSDPIWINDFSILLKNLTQFFPSKFHTNEERLNAIVRLSLYISIILSLYYSKLKYFTIFIFFLGLTYIIYKHYPQILITDKSIQEKVQQQVEEQAMKETLNPKLNNFIPSSGLNYIEKLENQPINTPKCTQPTVDNPFMNVTMKDYMNFDKNGFIVDRPPACDPNDPEIKKKMDNAFSNNLYKDVSDVFDKHNSQRNYFTMPWTTIPNKQNEFGRWLYLSPKTCKENQDNCLRYEDLRSNRFIMPNPNRNPISTKKDN